jgi:hypothetical protein
VLMSHIVAKDKMTAIFHIREWWKIYIANFPGFILAYFIPMTIMYVLSFSINILSMTIILGFLIPFIFPVITLLFFLIGNSMYAQAYVVGLQRLEHE